MDIRPRQSLCSLVWGLVLACVLIGLLGPSPVRADVGVQPILPGGSSIKPGEETPIQMAAEVVTINVRPATEADNALVTLTPKYYGLQVNPVWFPGIAEVEADFTMKNPTGEAVSMTAWFPLASALENTDWNFNPGEIVPRIVNFQVSVDGKLLDYAVSELPNPKGADKPALPWASFPVSFPGEKETFIHVSYLLPLQPSVKGSEAVVYYIFQTGAGWAGPIGQAELILNLPYPASEGTLASIPPGRLSMPYYGIPREAASLPSGVVLEGNQARWTWTDFEPGPEDDFAVWLLRPSKWQELEAARLAVQANPQDGRAWLDLAFTYCSLSANERGVPLMFSPSYLPSGLEAYQKAADRLPENPAPHAGLALLTLAPYVTDKNAPPEVLQYVQDEFQVAKELEAKNPSWADEAGNSGWLLKWLEEALVYYYYNDATATVDAATQAIWNATRTAEATRDYATSTARAVAKATFMACWATAGVDWEECNYTPSPTATLTPKPTHTPTPTLPWTAAPSATPQLASPTPTSLAQPGQSAGQKRTLAIIVAGGAIGLVVVGSLALGRLRKGAGKTV